MAEGFAVSLGGYENEFVDSVGEDLSCSICLLPFRDPHLVSCCGAKFCELCIGRVKAVSQPCPLCKQEFNTMLDRKEQRKVLNLKVYCSKHEDGCQWVGELRRVDSHEREECEWAMAECSYQCGAILPRKMMAKHQHDECQQRPVLKLERMMRSMEERHASEMRKIEEKIETESNRLEQEFDIKLATEKECHQNKVRKLKEQHKKELATVTDEVEMIKDEHFTKMADIEKRVHMLEKSVAKVKDMEEETRDILISSHPLPSYTEFTMADYKSHRISKSDWISPPFYSGLRGYKMCLKVFANGCGRGAGTHLSVFVNLMRGENDSTLNWPFQGAVTVQLINRKTESCKEVIVNFDRAAVQEHISDRVTSGEIAIEGWGRQRFMTHHRVESYIEYTLDSDCLTFRIVKIVVEDGM